jgi:hypothetical protein
MSYSHADMRKYARVMGSLADRLSNASRERAELIARVSRLPIRSQARTIAAHRLTIVTAQVLSIETKLNRKAQNEPASRN